MYSIASINCDAHSIRFEIYCALDVFSKVHGLIEWGGGGEGEV